MHINEHVLELLVLGDSRVLEQEADIRKHLNECNACNALYLDIKEYYYEVQSESHRLQVGTKGYEAGKSQLARRDNLQPYFDRPNSEVGTYREIRIPSVWSRAGRFGREHPVVTSFFAIALFVALYYLWARLFQPAENPSYYRYDTYRGLIEVYDASNKLIWSLPASNVENSKKDEEYDNVHHTLISDLNGNGRNEVITVVPSAKRQQPNPLRVFNSSGKLLESFDFKGSAIEFNGIRYDVPFQPGCIISEKMSNGKMNLFVFSSNGRSPSFLARLDPRLKVIGKYWHFGNFKPYLIDDFENGVKKIAITGEDDMNDMSDGNFEFLAILLPSKIVGDKESSATPGFGYRVSDAEQYYVKFPKTDLEVAEGTGGDTRITGDSNDSLLYVSIFSGKKEYSVPPWEFQYIFSLKDMRVQQVKYSNPAPQTFAKLRKEGKLQGDFDERYLERLKEGIRYWNGKTWSSSPTAIDRN